MTYPDYEISAEIMMEMANYQGSEIVKEEVPKEVCVEFSFTHRTFAELINTVIDTARAILNKAQNQKRIEHEERQHVEKVMARRNGVSFTPTAFVPRPVVHPPEMHDDLLAAAMLHVFHGSKRWGTAFTLISRQMESIYRQCDEEAARIKETRERIEQFQESQVNSEKAEQLQRTISTARTSEQLLKEELSDLQLLPTDQVYPAAFQLQAIQAIKHSWNLENRGHKFSAPAFLSCPPIQFKGTPGQWNSAVQIRQWPFLATLLDCQIDTTRQQLNATKRAKHEIDTLISLGNDSLQSVLEALQQMERRFTSLLDQLMSTVPVEMTQCLNKKLKVEAENIRVNALQYAASSAPAKNAPAKSTSRRWNSARTSVREWPFLTSLIACRIDTLNTSIEKAQALIDEASATLAAQPGIRKEIAQLEAALEIHIDNEDAAKQMLKDLKDSVIKYDVAPCKEYLKNSLTYKKVKDIRAIFFQLVSDEATTLRQKSGLISRHVARGICDTAMPIDRVADRILNSVRGEPNYTSTSRAQRDSDSVYQDSNDVAILDHETAHVTTQLLSLLGYNNGSLIEVTNGGRVQVGIQEIEETIRIFENVLEEQQRIQDFEELSDQTLDAVTIFDLTVTRDALREQLDAYTAPSCSGIAYALGSGGLRRLYVVPA